jgi:hypothetical protein
MFAQRERTTEMKRINICLHCVKILGQKRKRLAMKHLFVNLPRISTMMCRHKEKKVSKKRGKKAHKPINKCRQWQNVYNVHPECF